MADKVSRRSTEKRRGVSIPKEHIPRVDLKISEVQAIKLNTKESLCKKKFPTKTTQRPKSVKNNQVSPSRGASTPSPTSTRASNSSSRTLEPTLERQRKENVRRFSKGDSTWKIKETRHCVKGKESVTNYVKNYANVRIFGNHAKGKNVLVEGKKLKEGIKNTKIALSFTEEVLKERSELHLRSYPGPNAELFTYTKTKPKPRKLKPIGIISRHETCLPRFTYETFPRPNPRYLHRNGSKIEEETFIDIPSSTAFWEQYVLSLLSKSTAQWIANQCSSGEKRNYLIEFLDDMYNVDFEEEGAISARKLLENDDDCITKETTRIN